MKRMKINLNTAVMLLLVVTLFGAIALVNRNQETRRGAYFAGAKLFLLPSTATVNNGDDLLVHLVAESDLVGGSTTNKAVVENAQFYVCYDKNLDLPVAEESSRIVVNQDNGFETKIVFYEELATKKCANITVISGYGQAMRDKLKSGVVDVATVHFKTVAAGAGSVTIDKGLSKVSGTNDSSIDKSISVDTVENMTYTIGDGQGQADVWPVLNFKIAFGGVANTARCAVNWPLRVTVLGNGVTRVYNDVKATADNKISLRLTDFNQTSNLAVFVKGPKHLQMKYGKNNQMTLYDKAGGELGGLTTDAATSPWFDFSRLPLLAGDVTGETTGVQDGVIDGRDFSYIKSIGSLPLDDSKRAVAAGGYLPADLDGNCFVNVQDVTLLMKSLEEKQGQLY